MWNKLENLMLLNAESVNEIFVTMLHIFKEIDLVSLATTARSLWKKGNVQF
jgi:hypothetical protein